MNVAESPGATGSEEKSGITQGHPELSLEISNGDPPVFLYRKTNSCDPVEIGNEPILIVLRENVS